MEKRYWKGIEELNNDPEFLRLRDNEFFEHLPVDEVLQKKASSDSSTSRRDFLKFMGFSVAAASLAACEAPVNKAIPYVVKPEEITLGTPNYYASSYFNGSDYCSIIIKTREGRPIKIEGNTESPVTGGATNARVQASVLSLYDSARLNSPMAARKRVDWNVADGEITKRLASATAPVVLLSSSIASPSAKKVVDAFLAKYPGSRHVVYDAVSYYGITRANELSFGKAVIPSYHFENAATIVSFGADFLANWLSPVEYSRQYGMARKLRDGKKNMSRHIQVEAMLSVTGSNADTRYKLKPSQIPHAVAGLYNRIAALAGGTSVSASNTSIDKQLDGIAQELWNARGKSLVVSGSNDPNEQVLVNAINNLLGNYGTTINLDQVSNLHNSNDAAVNTFISDVNNGRVGGVIFWNTNPVYTLAAGKEFSSALAKVPLKISLSDREDETAMTCDFVCPSHHYLESWNDLEPYSGTYSLVQPAISPLYNTRQAEESLLRWAGLPHTDYYSFLKENWNGSMFNTQTGISSFDAFWTRSLRDGAYSKTPGTHTPVSFAGNVSDAASALPKPATGPELVLYEKTGMGNGSQANNPWLLELPDPVSRVSWDNYFAVLPAYADKMGYTQGTIITVKAGNNTVKGPVLLQPAMADETIAIAVGYGRTHSGKAGNNVGVNAYPLVSTGADGIFRYNVSGITVNKTPDDLHQFAATQSHHTMMGRPIVKNTTLAAWQKDPKSGNPDVMISTPYGDKKASTVDLWATPEAPEHAKPNHFWGMAVDLNSCIGCGSCVVSCVAENNIPVVGKDEVMRAREMHWIRIDRYYASDTTKANAKDKGLGKLDMYAEMEKPAADNPEVYFQPLMCLHCNQAPCETVCPVVATTHSSDGLNMMAYNRCVGTRYCANNCPYKVRRFNWWKYSDNEQFPYNMTDSIGKMVLNPDVTVRSRGVMEKCTMCVQRIQYGRLEAKKQSRRPKDGEIQTACAQACPTDAIVFGDYNDPDSRLTQMFKDERTYQLLEELKTRPGVFYQTKIRNAPEGATA